LVAEAAYRIRRPGNLMSRRLWKGLAQNAEHGVSINHGVAPFDSEALASCSRVFDSKTATN
jgi:hypothetical protein